MIEYLNNNKQWIFSGIGVFIISLFISGIIYLSKNERQLPTTGSETTPSQIVDSIAKYPPLQQSDIAKSYVGTKINWNVEFASASMAYENDNNFVNVALRDTIIFDGINPKHHTWILCSRLALSNHPELKSLKEGNKLNIKGIVSKVSPDDRSIDIEKATFSY